MDPTGIPFRFHLVHCCYYLHTQCQLPNLGALGFESSFLSFVIGQVLKVLGPSTSVVYALSRMDTSFESIKSVMALHLDFVRANSPNVA